METKHISLLGDKDHGKSTLIGSVLMLTGAATPARISEAKLYSEKLHKPFEPAFILDSFSEEREHEMTYDTTRAQIKYKDLAFGFIDVPGHEELIKNMISGASYGEIAILLVSAKKGEGIRDQTRRHLFISKMLGINKLVVAVNKMDSVGYDEKRFKEIRSSLENFIIKVGFEKENVHFVPISAYNGENLIKKSEKMKWYKGNSLVDVIYQTAKKKDKVRVGKLRIVVQGALDHDNNVIVGKIVSGKLSTGNKVSILPKQESVNVKELMVKGKKTRVANVGENVAIKFNKKIGFDPRGTVIAELKDKPSLIDSVRARIFVTNKIGKNLQIKFNGIDIKCKKIKVLSGIDTTTGEKAKINKPEVLNAINAELRFEKKLPIEEFETTKELGRFVLYSGKEFAGIGIVV